MSLAAVLNTLVERVVTPRQIGVYNGVAARDCGLVSRHEPQHKAVLAGAVRDVVSPGDRVIVVGGGRAVVAVHAARCGGVVTVYEAGADAMRVTESVLALNDVVFETQAAVVGEPGAVAGTPATDRVDPAALEGDVLVLDCEGAERDILPVDGFDHVVVETHPEHGSPLATISDALGSHEVVGDDPIDGQVVVS
jgi:hypothetical protein